MSMQSLEKIEKLAAKMKSSKTLIEKITVLEQEESVYHFFHSSHSLKKIIDDLTIEKKVAILQLIAMNQAPLGEEFGSKEKIEELLNHLVAVDDFYRELGGLAGYQREILNLLQTKKSNRIEANFHSPHFIDISNETDDVSQAIENGIRAMPFLCEMYPVGGAADRLHLVDEKTGHELPAAKLEFARATLLTRMIRDLEAREYLYYQLTGQVITTPIALMTSQEKDNNRHILEILEQNRWFNRPKERVRLFEQPLVPVVNQHGMWVWSAPWQLVLKPGGHGVIWKLAKDHGIFEWFQSLGAKFALVRQINNPLAGIDYGLLAFTGIGFSKKRSFGFASCPRLCQAAEGMNVLIERKIPKGFSYVVSNIEYTDFEKFGIIDRPLVSNAPYSRFSSNTNILFVDLKAIEAAIEKCPFPGLIINLKKKNENEASGRLESAMQNIADVFVEKKRERLTKESHALNRTFITYNHRHKTISTTKKAMVAGGSYQETPENCFYDMMQAHRELLIDVCGFSLPACIDLEKELATHPSFVFLFHPAFGPLYRTIAKKIRKGCLSNGSELILEIIDADIENLIVDGSVQILADHPLGSKRFSSPPRCVLKNVQVMNRGVDWENSKPFWKGRYQRFESLEIILHDRSEFIAKDVSFKNGERFEVRDGERMIVSQDENSLIKINREAAAR